MRYRPFTITATTLTFCLILLVVPVLSAAMQHNDSEVLIHGQWRSGEMVRFELSESVMIYEDGILAEERNHTTVVMAEVAGIRAQQGYVLLWRILRTDATLFGDPTLDEFMYGVLADGIVVHTDIFGAYDYSSNIEDLFSHFSYAVETLNQRGHWNDGELREYIQYYLDDIERFEELLIRDMRFIFGMHGVQIAIHEPYSYETWQENPWGEPLPSTGSLRVDSYSADDSKITVSNTVELSNPLADGPSLSESQQYIIRTDSGWPQVVKLGDEIQYRDFSRSRSVIIRKIVY